MYKVGDNVQFSFLGMTHTGTILEVMAKDSYKVKSNTSGHKYPHLVPIEKVDPKATKPVYGVIIKKL